MGRHERKWSQQKMRERGRKKNLIFFFKNPSHFFLWITIKMRVNNPSRIEGTNSLIPKTTNSLYPCDIPLNNINIPKNMEIQLKIKTK